METPAGDATVTVRSERIRRFPSISRRRDSATASVNGRRRRRAMLFAVAVTILAGPALAVAIVVLVALSGRDVSQTLHFPAWLDSRTQNNKIAYPFHVTLARTFGILGLSPVAEGLQWFKAAAHATTDEQIRTIGEGVRSALARTGPSDRAQASVVLCDAARRGSQAAHAMAVALAGMDCQIELQILGHVPEGQPIYYQSNPPIGGPHYGATYPEYGIVQTPVAPGYWVHNLEHGAIVVLYQCDEACPELIANLDDLYARLPPGRNGPSGRPRLLAVPYPELPAPLAMVTWGSAVLLDRFDADVVQDFYRQNADHGPECRALRCPE